MLNKIISILLFLSLLACSSQEYINIDDLEKYSEPKVSSNEEKILYIGFDLRWEPVEDVKFYLPFIEYLKKETGLNIKFMIPRSYQENIFMLGNGDIDISFMGAVSCMIANIQFGAEPLVVGLNEQKKPTYQSIIVKRKNDNTIKNIKNIKGKRVAFGNKYSTQGYLIPRKMLEDNGISLNEIIYEFSESHKDAVNKLINGYVDVAAIQDKLAKKLLKDGIIDIVAISDYYPSSTICISKKVSPEIRDKLKNAILSYHDKADKKTLEMWKDTEMSSGFLDANMVNFNKVKKLIKMYYGIK